MDPKPLLLDPSLLAPNPWNTNFASPDSEAKLDESLRRFGMFKPVIVREHEGGYQILGGEHRWASSKRIGLTQIPVFNLGPLDDATAKKIGIADNSRYGADDAMALAELLGELGTPEELAEYLPYTDNDFRAIFSTTDIALDDLDMHDALGEEDAKRDEPAPSERPTKTHVIMRFKVPIADSERITKRVSRVQKEQGFTLADELTNAGDALVHILLPRDDEDQSVLTDGAA